MPKKRTGLLTRPRSITGSKKLTTPKSLKPQQARQLIRRFHILQKNKTSILSRLNKSFGGEEDLTETNYKDILASRKEWKKFYLPNLESSAGNAEDIIKIDSTITIPQLFTQLSKIDAEIEKRGGLQAYQSASIHGQNSNRGGDSSKKLIEWLNQPPYTDIISRATTAGASLSALEIGCLNATNYISTSGIFASIERIDLNSQSQHILQQNFMERPLPKSNKEKFNLISCSLVLNFVPTPRERGEMLRRITKFLLPPNAGTTTTTSFSSLFFVLPLPCLQNSRYIDTTIFEAMMHDLGFVKMFSYEATKIIYYLFEWQGKQKKQVQHPKKQVYSGPKRNNFCIVFE